LDIRLEFINIGGGIGIAYRPEQAAFNLAALAAAGRRLFDEFVENNGFEPKFYMESGRFMTGPHGVLVTRAINRKDTYRRYVGVDASMADLMRPGIYGAYHHITVPAHHGRQMKAEVVDVVGPLCENNDKFAIQRRLPPVETGDLLCIHDTGAHGQSMGFNYNGRLRPKELLLRSDGAVELIRRAETVDDYFATLQFEPQTMPAVHQAQFAALKN
jgi:diaminopimelate decarboxylase